MAPAVQLDRLILWQCLIIAILAAVNVYLLYSKPQTTLRGQGVALAQHGPRRAIPDDPAAAPAAVATEERGPAGPAAGEPAAYYNSTLLGMALPAPWDPFNLTELIRDNLERDIRSWQELRPGKALLRDLLDMARNDSSLCKGLTNVRRLVEIKGGKLRFPFMPKGDLQTDCDPGKGHYCDPSMKPWAALLRTAARFNLEYPDVVFLLGVKDHAMCSEGMVRAGPCKAPCFNTGKEEGLMADLMMPPLTPSFVKVIARGLPWTSKSDKAFFRGVPSCTGGILGFPGQGWCARSVVARMAQFNHSDVLDAGLTEPYNRPYEIAADPTLRDGHGPLPVLPHVPLDELPAYKYLLNLDGHVAGWRLGILLGVNSLVLKQESAYIEWFYRSLKPYEHYVPIFNRSMTDLIPQLNWAKSHQQQVQRVIANANAMAMRYATLHARLVYIKYALIAYKRLFADMDAWFAEGGPGSQY